MFVYMLVILIFLFTFSALIGEIYRIHSIRTHVEYELQRAVNIAVEEAMRDSWRQDKLNKLDTIRAEEDLMDYLTVHLGLNAAYQKHNEGNLIYELALDTLTVTEDPPRLFMQGKITIINLFPFLSQNIEIPFSISSKNGRID